MQTELTNLGCHRIMSRMPAFVAMAPNRYFVKTSAIGTSVKFAKPSRAGCVKGTRSSVLFASDCVEVATFEFNNAIVVWRLIIRLPITFLARYFRQEKSPYLEMPAGH